MKAPDTAPPPWATRSGEIARARFVPVHKGADRNPASHLPPPLEPPAASRLLSHRPEQPVHGTGARREQPLSHTWVQVEMTVSLQGLDHAGQGGLQPLAADPVRSLPHHDQRLSHRLVVDARPLGYSMPGTSSQTRQPDGVLPVAAHHGELVEHPTSCLSSKPPCTRRGSLRARLVAGQLISAISMPP